MAKETTFCFRLNATERARLEAVAFARGISSSALAREVLTRFLDGFFTSGDQGDQVLKQFREMKRQEAEAQRLRLEHLEAILTDGQNASPPDQNAPRRTRN